MTYRQWIVSLGFASISISLIVLVIYNTWYYNSDHAIAVESMGRGAWMESMSRSQETNTSYNGLQRNDFIQFMAIKPKLISYTCIYHRGYDISKGVNHKDCIAILVPENVGGYLSRISIGDNRCISLHSNGATFSVNFSEIKVVDFTGWERL